MKKRILAALLLALTLSFALTGCKKEKSSRVSYQMFDYGVAALEIIDDYRNGRISDKEAIRRLDQNISRQESHLSDEKKKLSEKPPSSDSLVVINTRMAVLAIMDKSCGTGTMADVTEKYNSLRDTLYE